MTWTRTADNPWDYWSRLTKSETLDTFIHIFTRPTADASDTNGRVSRFTPTRLRLGIDRIHVWWQTGRTRGIPRVRVSTNVLQQRFHMQETLTPPPHMAQRVLLLPLDRRFVG